MGSVSELSADVVPAQSVAQMVRRASFCHKPQRTGGRDGMGGGRGEARRRPA